MRSSGPTDSGMDGISSMSMPYRNRPMSSKFVFATKTSHKEVRVGKSLPYFLSNLFWGDQFPALIFLCRKENHESGTRLPTKGHQGDR